MLSIKWEYSVAEGEGAEGWSPFPQELSRLMTDAIVRNRRGLLVRSGEHSYAIDLDSLTQINQATKTRRKIRGTPIFQDEPESAPSKRKAGGSHTQILTQWVEMPRDQVGKDDSCQVCLMEFHEDEDEKMENKQVEQENPGSKKTKTATSVDVPPAASVFDCVKLSKCHGHYFHKTCIERWFEQKPKCPSCSAYYAEEKGNQPRGGTMTFREDETPLPGYPDCGSIVVWYMIPGGIQTSEHPNPGLRYFGTTRMAFLPANEEGKQVLALLERAFKNRVSFTIGTSLTTGVSNVVIWNGIHHKTSRTGGIAHYGYPDPTYLNRVTLELASKGIV
mmetsp:Transcript_9907/g.16233  ORF Transcript_9907/g.16233 Transcript_9907/m.16233 type:complete len:333 (-) Transcript_9907:1077-2075(-)